MSRGIHPVFSNVHDHSVAESLSEPLLREGDFLAQRVGATTLPFPEPGDLAAVCSAYIGSEGEVATRFELATQNERPYASTYIFIRGYKISVPGLQNEVMGRSTLRDAAASGELTHLAIEKAKEQELRTLASFLLFLSDDGDYRGMIAIPRRIVEVSGVEAMGVREIPKGKAGQVTESRLRRTGFLIGAMSLPSMTSLERLIDAHPAVVGYSSLSRGERQKKSQQENKAAREKSKK